MMDRRTRILIIAFIESFATILLERGLYFFTENRLGFSEAANLSIALAFGVAYVLGALLSHPVAMRLGEKRTLVGVVVAVMLMHVALMLNATTMSVVIFTPLVAFVTGMKWPIVESYVSAGHTPRNTLRMVGRFNVAWATAVPLGVAISGPIIDSPRPAVLFGVAAAINIVTLLLLRRLAAAPTHLEHDHPDRLAEREMLRYRSLLTSSRWLLLCSFTLLFILAPLMPQIFTRLGVDVKLATTSAALLDVVRVLTFAILGLIAVWHGRPIPLTVVIVLLPISFFMVLFGGSLPTVLAGEILFGASSGLAYYAALYYAMVVKNASVDAGGAHEGLIGCGFAMGPLLGLVGLRLASPFGGGSGGYLAGMLAGTAPIIVICAIGAVIPLFALCRAAPVREIAEPAPEL